MTNPPPAIGNLDAKRLQRAQARAAKREGHGETLPIVFGGETIAVLAAEFPIDVLEPVQDINLDIALLLQQAVANANATEAGRANMELIVNILAANPDLPRELVGAVKEIGLRLLGPDGYSALCAGRPTPWDVAALVGDLFSWYGLTLGEALRSSTSSPTDGGTSNTIASSTSGSTPVESGNGLASPVSSDSLGSSA